MANDVANLQIEVDSKQVRAAIGVLESLEKQGGRTENRFTTMGRQAQQMGRQMSMYLTAPILGAGAVAVKTAADYETLRTQLEVLVGSAEKADRIFGQLAEFAATTPFEIDGIVRANNLLLGFGVSVEQTQDLLKTLGDIAAVSGGDLFSLARITGEARAENKLLTRDLRQLIAQGVPAIKLLADSMGVAESAIFDMASAGEIGFNELIAAFQRATSEGGLFFEGMEKRSNTLAGIFSNAMDSINQSLASVGQTIIDVLDIKGVTRELIANLDRATEWFDNLDESTQRMLITFAGMLAAIGPVIAILGTLSLAIGAISAPVAAVAAAVALGTTAIVKNWSEVEAYFTTGGGAQMWKDLQGIVEGTITIVKGLWSSFGDDFIAITENSFTRTLRVVETLLSDINVVIATWADLYNGEYGSAFDRVEEGWRQHASNIKGFVDDILATVNPVMNLKRNAVDAILGSEEDWEGGVTIRKKQVLDLKNTIDTLNFLNTDFSSFAQANKAVEDLVKNIEGVTVAAKKPEDTIFDPTFIGASIEPMQQLNDIVREMGDYDFSHRLGMDDVKKDIEETNEVARELGFTFSSAFEDAVVQLTRTKDVLESLGRIAQSVLEDILRITTRTLITGPLSEALTGALSGGGGSVEPVNDLIITNQGRVFKPSPDDTIMAMKNPGAMAGNQANVPITINTTVKNDQGINSDVEVQERRGPDGSREIEMLITNTMKGAMNSGKLDRTMARNYGVRRTGVNHG